MYTQQEIYLLFTSNYRCHHIEGCIKEETSTNTLILSTGNYIYLTCNALKKITCDTQILKKNNGFKMNILNIFVYANANKSKPNYY